MKKKYQSPCCGRFTLDECPTGTYSICSKCGWEDDPVQFENIDYAGGANAEGLRQAREKFLKNQISMQKILNKRVFM